MNELIIKSSINTSMSYNSLERRLFGNEEVNSVSLRELYLDLGYTDANFTTWCKENLLDSEFEENEDYFLFIKNGGTSGFIKTKTDYIVTLDTGKELAMMSRKPKGKQIRKYFIEVEKAATKKHVSHMDLPNTLEANKKLAELFGLKGNQALLSANRATKNETGVDCLAKMDIKLISETKEQILTPTEIGKILDPSLSGIAINKILQAFGFQEKVGKVWQPTEKGMEFAELLDTGKQHSDGTPVKQVKWKYSILKLIED